MTHTVCCCRRISHLERDLGQKRVLIDDVKLKLNAAQENAANDADIMVLQLCVPLLNVLFTFRHFNNKLSA